MKNRIIEWVGVSVVLIIFIIIITYLTLSGRNPTTSSVRLVESSDPHINILRIDSIEITEQAAYEAIQAFINTIALESRIWGIEMLPTTMWDISDVIVTVETQDIVDVTLKEAEDGTIVFYAESQRTQFEGDREVDRIYYEGYITLKVSDKSLEIIFDDYKGGH